MTELTKFSDHLKNMTTHDRHKLADAVQAAAATLPANELRVLIDALSAEMVKQEAATGKEAVRKAKLAKAMKASATDQSAQHTLTNIRDELRRIGLSSDIDAAAAKGGFQLQEIDRALKATDWKPERKMNLKNKLDAVGLLTY
jgi:hypothetical protein